MRPRRELGAPLVCWLVSLGAIGLLILGAGLWQARADDIAQRILQAAIDADVHRLLAPIPDAAHRRARVVFILGDSLTCCAVGQDDLWSRNLSAMAGQKVYVVVVAMGGLSFRELRTTSQVLLKLKPDLVVMQQELLQQPLKEQRSAAEGLITAPRNMLYWIAITNKLWKPAHVLKCNMQPLKVSVETALEKSSNLYRRPALSADALDFINALLMQKGKVVLVEFGRALSIDNRLRSAIQAWRQQIFQSAPAIRRLPEWHIDGPTDERAYLDHSHMMATSRPEVRRQMLPLLDAMLRQPT